jgi:dihydropteroate synthase
MFTLNCNGRLLAANEPLIMGIINVTPDSFYERSREQHLDGLLMKVALQLTEGADIIDIGGQSTRPGSTRVSVNEELERVIPAIEKVIREFPNAFISIDTFYAEVAREAVNAGAGIVNDISAGSIDPAMFETVATLNVPYILMHMKGEPSTMHHDTKYNDVFSAVSTFLMDKIAALNALGIHDIIIDPGFGFGKNTQQNFTLLKRLREFSIFPFPLMAGLSRKGMVYKTLSVTADEALNGTAVLNTIALLNGASILRVHDVKEAVEARKLISIYNQEPEL